MSETIEALAVVMAGVDINVHVPAWAFSKELKREALTVYGENNIEYAEAALFRVTGLYPEVDRFPDEHIDWLMCIFDRTVQDYTGEFFYNRENAKFHMILNANK